MNFYIMLDNDDASTEEIEFKNGCVYCKCPKCGNPFAPPAVFGDDSCATIEMRYCRDCHDKIEEKRLKKQFSEFYKFAADLLSKAYKVNFSIEDVHYIWNSSHSL